MSGPGRQNTLPNNRHGPPSHQRWRPRWDNAEESCGHFITKLPGGKSVWMAVGPAAHEWQKTLSPRIRTQILEKTAFHTAGVSMFIYMVGRDKSTASPRIIFCSSDIVARKAFRGAVEQSGILTSYPAIGLGDSSSPLARGDSGLGRRTPNLPTQETARSHQENRVNNVFTGDSEPISEDSEAVTGSSSTTGRPQATPRHAVTLDAHFERLSISSDYASSLISVDESLASNPRSSDWTPTSSVHALDEVSAEEARFNRPRPKNTHRELSDGADDRESYSESEELEDSKYPGSGHSDPTTARRLNEIVSKLLDEFDSSRQCPSGRVDQGVGSAESQAPSDSAGSSRNQVSPGNGVSRASLGKRPMTGDSAEDGGGSVTISKKTKTVHQTGKVMACPFWKKDPSAYSRCYRLELKEVKRVKQHLYRIHVKLIRCPRCQEVFPDRASCDEHIRNTDCIRQPTVINEGIDQDQQTELSKRGSAALSQEQRWFVVWRIVFPGVPEPASSYIDDDLSEDMCEFREFYQRTGSIIVLDYMRTSSDWSPEDEERFRQSSWRTLLDDALDGIHHRWLAQRIRAGRSNSQATIQLAVEPPGEGLAGDVTIDSSPSPSGVEDGLDSMMNTFETGSFRFAGDPTVPESYDSSVDWLFSPQWQNGNEHPGA